MTPTRTHAALLLAAIAGAAATFAHHGAVHAQTQASPPQAVPAPPPSQVPQPPTRPQPAPRAVIFLDPAHGGPETGAALGNNIAEKDVTLAFAQRLRTALGSADLGVVTTRDSDLSAPLPTDQRAETANRSHALACIVVHATASGTGVHIFTSTLAPALPADDSSPPSSQDAGAPFTPIPWESAQAGFIDRSRQLSDVLKAALAKRDLPVLTGTAALRPLDNLLCPAVAIEIAPGGADNAAPSSDTGYQQRIATAIASALDAWRTQNTPQTGGAQ